MNMFCFFLRFCHARLFGTIGSVSWFQPMGLYIESTCGLQFVIRDFPLFSPFHGRSELALYQVSHPEVFY